MRFSGLRAVVTGAASGIGAEVARSLSAEGATVTALDLKTASDAGRPLGHGARPRHLTRET
ncbi:SDR family NAD(P)-dependent oxidoreductase [Pseudonocardia sp. 73-21]|jgi:NAD(P)-dependent dehydrogenase (short-subunit alcohol dehydrogenase family)|uniref:SDR family NAD(P)-dependent oxidoreductase n=1 Tax=Pseudonocardia sp. 73-21 TaxID=1895809 RepID=UPI00095D8B69|nr:SDR family NAD(P)-dependent oxidoreductase [Pseudonocardia sp. 73-21]OJY39852.1 MAG: hypothetical protein BGP03_21475 [Pseudonocardia sp. 73-21]